MKEKRVKGKRYYYITECDLGFNIYRYKENENGTVRMEWLMSNWYTMNKDYAKVFYNESDVESALIIARSKWDKQKTESVSKEESDLKKGQVKSCWWELSLW